MKILFDIVHPADVLFFKRAIDMLNDRGDEIRICSRHKDVACALLDNFGYEHRTISSAATGVAGLACELAFRDMQLLRRVLTFKPDVMIGFGGVAISHCTAITGIPSISFYDSEGSKLQNSLTWPFITRLYVPECYYGRVPAKRTRRIAGVKELSYLHPRHFHADKTLAGECGLDFSCPNFFIRIVSWRANHDIGKNGWSAEQLQDVVRFLSERGRIHISSEVALPDGLEKFRFRGALDKVHHLLAHCALYIGESATMASEAAVLGVPSIFAGMDHLGYIRELSRHSLVAYAPLTRADRFQDIIREQLNRSIEDVRAARDAYVAARPDWAHNIVDALDEFNASPVIAARSNI